MQRTDGTPFNRESERERWEYVEAVETRLLRDKTVHQTVHELASLCAQKIGAAEEGPRNEERRKYLTMLQGRLSALSVPKRRDG